MNLGTAPQLLTVESLRQELETFGMDVFRREMEAALLSHGARSTDLRELGTSSTPFTAGCRVGAFKEDGRRMSRDTAVSGGQANGRPQTSGDEAFSARSSWRKSSIGSHPIELLGLRTNSNFEVKKSISVNRASLAALTSVEPPEYPGQVIARRFVKNGYFEMVFACAIFINTMLIGAEMVYFAELIQWNDQLEVKPSDNPFFFLSIVFAAVFLVEVVLRALAGGTSFFCDRVLAELAWNYFDLGIVIVSVVEVSFTLAIEGSGDLSGSDGTSARLVRIVRIARLLRLLRMARLVRLVRALRLLVYSIVLTLKSLLWAMFLLFLILYFFSLLFTQSVVDYLQESDCRRGVNSCSDTALVTHWSTLQRSMLTLFQAISGGIDWEQASSPLADVNGFLVFLFIIFMVFVYFAVLNVFTGVFVSSSIASAEADREIMIRTMAENKDMFERQLEEQFSEMLVQFKRGRHSEEICISFDELVEHVNHPCVRSFLTLLELDEADIWALFQLLDADGNQLLDAEEFVNGCLRFKGPARSIDLATFQQQALRMLRRIERCLSAGLEDEQGLQPLSSEGCENNDYNKLRMDL